MSSPDSEGSRLRAANLISLDHWPSGGAGCSAPPRVSTRGLVSAVAVAIMLAGCAARPGPETLDPVVERPQGNRSVTVLALTDRARTADKPYAFGDGRGMLSYEQFTIQAVKSTPDGNIGAAVISRHSDPSKDFVTTGRCEFDRASFQQSVARLQKTADSTVVFVHGYNTSYQEAVFRLAQLSVEADTRAVPILFSWPSQADFRGYVTDRDAATYARDDLVHLLTLLSRSPPRGRIAVVGHSMGAWLVMEALRQLRLEGRGDVIARLEVVLASPDIDVFRKQAAVVGRLSPPLTVLVSKDDRALAVSSRLTGGRSRLGLASADNPKMQAIARQSGVQIIDITTLPASDSLNHDRFVTFAARYASTARKDGAVGGVRHASVFLLDATGRILSAPFEGTARIIAGTQ